MSEKKAENEKRVNEVPTLLIGDKVLVMKTNAGIADRILKFSNDRRNLEVSQFLQSHIEILAEIFGATAQEISEKVDLGVVVSKFLDCLEYTARHLFQSSIEETSAGVGK